MNTPRSVQVISAALGRQKIAGYLQAIRNKYLEPLLSKKERLDVDLSNASSIAAELDRLESSQHEPVNVQPTLQRAKAAVVRITKKLKAVERYREGFRVEHNLTHIPVRKEIWSAVMILFFIMAAETLIDVSFFLNAHMLSGPGTTLLYCSLVSFTNTIISALSGYLSRYIKYGSFAQEHDKYRGYRLLAWVQLVLYLVTLAGFHMTVGLTRAFESIDIVEHSISNYSVVFTTPESLFLVLSGTALSVLAFRKGRKAFASVYPGDDDFQTAIDDLDDESSDLYEDVAEIIEDRFDESISQVDRDIKSQTNSCSAYQKAIEACRQSHTKLSKSVEIAQNQIRTDALQLLETYNAVHWEDGDKTEEAMTDLEALCELSHVLVVELPNQISPSVVLHGRRARLLEEKARALDQLAEIFEHYP